MVRKRLVCNMFQTIKLMDPPPSIANVAAVKARLKEHPPTYPSPEEATAAAKLRGLETTCVNEERDSSVGVTFLVGRLLMDAGEAVSGAAAPSIGAKGAGAACSTFL